MTRDLARQAKATSGRQHPLAVLLSCIDSRTPAELIFDLGIGDVLSVRVAGNIVTPEVLGSMEYSCAVAGAKLIVVMGHTRCGAVSTAVALAAESSPDKRDPGSRNLAPIIESIQKSMTPADYDRLANMALTERPALIDEVAAAHVLQMTHAVLEQSDTLRHLHSAHQVAIIGVIYDVATGSVQFLPHTEFCVA